MFPSRKTNASTVALAAIKDWRDAGHEIEALGTRLDQAREAAAAAKGIWAKTFWNTTVEGPESFYANIDYNWWERSEEVKMIGFTWMDHWFDNAGLDRRLDESWAKAREEKLQKARLGLA
jgi:hypothetical protein